MWRELTGNNLNQLRINQYNRLCHYAKKKLINEQWMFQAITTLSFAVIYSAEERYTGEVTITEVIYIKLEPGFLVTSSVYLSLQHFPSLSYIQQRKEERYTEELTKNTGIHLTPQWRRGMKFLDNPKAACIGSVTQEVSIFPYSTFLCCLYSARERGKIYG